MPMPSPSSLKLTYADYAALPEDGLRHELVDGEHHVTPAPAPRHQRIALNIGAALKTFAGARGLGLVFMAPLDVLLSPTDVVQPDLLFISQERAGIVGETNIEGAPDLVIEILSESTRRLDEIAKRKLYERCGVREYWIVDPVVETVKVYRRDGESFRRAAELSLEAGEALATALLPGLAIPLAEIFA